MDGTSAAAGCAAVCARDLEDVGGALLNRLLCCFLWLKARSCGRGVVVPAVAVQETLHQRHEVAAS